MQIILINGEDEYLKECAALEEAKSSLANSIEIFKTPQLYEDVVSVNIGFNTTYVVYNVDALPYVPTSDGLLILVAKPKCEIKYPGAKHSIYVPSLKSYEDNNEVLPWILKEGHRQNIDLSNYASAFFVNNGNRLRKIHSEIRKVVDLQKCGITDSVVTRQLFIRSVEITPKDIINAITNGNARAAVTYYDALQDLKDETGWIISYLMRHCLSILTAMYYKSKGKSLQDVASILGLHPFVVSNQIYPNVNTWKQSSLTQSLRKLGELDVLNKSGQRSVEFDLEEEIIRLSQEAFNTKRLNKESRV
jgi:DNA polymerase III delta subunit